MLAMRSFEMDEAGLVEAANREWLNGCPSAEATFSRVLRESHAWLAGCRETFRAGDAHAPRALGQVV